MKIEVLTENLNKALAVSSRVVSSRAQLPILLNVLLRAEKGGLTVLATDLEVGVRVRVGAKVEVEGEICVNARTLFEYVNTLPGGVAELEVEKEVLTVKMGKAKAKIPGMATEEFPSIPEYGGKLAAEMSMAELARVVERVGFAAARDESRPIFTGMLWKLVGGKLLVVATDGYRLSVDDMKGAKVGEKEATLVLPVGVLSEIVRSWDKEEGKIEMVVEEEKQQVIFRLGGVEWVSRLLAGEYPPYSQIMPTGYLTKLRLDRQSLLEAVRRAAIFSRDNAGIVRLAIEGEKMVVSANSAQVGGSETEMGVEGEGEPLVVAFNGKYLIEYLAAMEAEEIVFESGGALKAGVFKVEGEKLTHIIMPVRVQG